jgi:hypothetical protein
MHLMVCPSNANEIASAEVAGDKSERVNIEKFEVEIEAQGKKDFGPMSVQPFGG